MKVIVLIYAPSLTTVELSAHGETLYRKWRETDNDADFEDLAEYILEDVAGNLDIEIEDVEESA